MGVGAVVENGGGDESWVELWGSRDLGGRARERAGGGDGSVCGLRRGRRADAGEEQGSGERREGEARGDGQGQEEEEREAKAVMNRRVKHTRTKPQPNKSFPAESKNLPSTVHPRASSPPLFCPTARTPSTT